MHSTRLGGEVALRRPLARLLTVAAFVGFLVPVASAGASSSGQTSKDVADRIVKLQSKADRTAAALAQAEIEHDDIAGQITVAETNVAARTAEYDGLTSQLASLAVDRYMSSSSGPADIFFGSPIDELQTEALAAAAYDAGATTLDDVETAKSALEVEQAHLADLQAQNDALTQTMTNQQNQIDDQLQQLVALKATLVDAEAKKAYADAVAKQKAADAAAEAAAQAKADAKAAAKTAKEQTNGATTSTSVVPTSTTSAPAAGTGNDAGTTADTAAAGTKDSAVAVLPAAPTPGDGTDPQIKDPVVVIDTSFVCPMAGPTAFGDTWGDARSGGRHHEGVDMMAAFGTPEVAVVSGDAIFKTNTLGGNVIVLKGDDGNGYYYAHLSSWEGQSRHVSQGEVIGYVGHTGDTSANHLHFEIHPGEGAAVNPYPTVRKYC
ncbi:MAG: putative metalloendopeptidase [Ilumatobacteraceae bacterium]|nr:putative metalloendopeptidase [Ilumatobacteraceae bacterium]